MLGYIPGLKELLNEKSVKGVGEWFWELVTITVGFSFFSMIITHGHVFNTIVVFLNFALAVVMLLIKNSIKYDKSWGTLLTIVFVLFLAFVYFVLPISVGVLQTLATLSIIFAYFNQITHFLLHKTAKGVNKNMYLVIGIGILLLVLSMVLTNTYWHVIVTEVTNLVLIMICYLLTIYYEKKESNT